MTPWVTVYPPTLIVFLSQHAWSVLNLLPTMFVCLFFCKNDAVLFIYFFYDAGNICGNLTGSCSHSRSITSLSFFSPSSILITEKPQCVNSCVLKKSAKLPDCYKALTLVTPSNTATQAMPTSGDLMDFDTPACLPLVFMQVFMNRETKCLGT